MHPLSLYNSDPTYYCVWWDMVCCLYFGSLRKRFALLKSPRMIKTESDIYIYIYNSYYYNYYIIVAFVKMVPS